MGWCEMSLVILLTLPAMAAPPSEHRPVDELSWTPLNPARGDASPRAADLWGERDTAGPAGFLVRFADGFASPPHVHNVSYRAVVLEGRVHNDDPTAAPMWMAPGSFWTQPRGEAHITSATGVSIAYVEIDSGPYLVAPADQAEDHGERPVNVDTTNLVWRGDGVQTADLWGRPGSGTGGMMIRFGPAHPATLSSAAPLRAVVVRGQVAGETAGSLLSGKEVPLTCTADPCWVYVRGESGISVRPATSPGP